MWDQNGFYDGAGHPYSPPDPGLGLPAGDNPQFWYADAITPTVLHSIQTAVPEPATLSLLAMGVGLFAMARRWRRRPPSA